jgi:hypothetical protein
MSGKVTLSDIQNNLPNKFTGKNIIEGKELSLIINLSTCMFISEYIKNLPEILYKYRFSEVALQFYLEQKGKIGFISTPLSVYRKNKGGFFTGADVINQLKQRYLVRQNAYMVCVSEYKKDLKKIVSKEYKRYILNKYFSLFKKIFTFFFIHKQNKKIKCEHK